MWDRHTCGTDSHMGQTHIWYRLTYGTDTHVGQTHIWDRLTFLTFLNNEKNPKIPCNFFVSCLIAPKMRLLPAQLHGESGKTITLKIG